MLLILLYALSPFAMGLPLELIVMVDTSNSMERYFDDLVEYIITDTLKKNLHPGDTFHLIRFSSYPVHELTQIISDEESTDMILKKMSFLKRKLFFGKYTDIPGALQYLILYAEGLPKRHNKKLLMLSDFIHNPSPDSQYAGIHLPDLEKELTRQAQTIREREGWSIHFVRFPDQSREAYDRDTDTAKDTTSDTSSESGNDTINDSLTDTVQDPVRDTERDMGDDSLHTDPENESTNDNEEENDTNERTNEDEQDVVDIISDTFDVDIPTFDENEKEDLAHKTTGFPRLEFPGNLGNKGRVFQAPFIIHNYLDDNIIIKLHSLEYAGKNILHAKVDPKFVGPRAWKQFKVTIKLPPDIKEGPCTLPITLTFDDDYRISPRQGFLNFNYTGDVWIGFFNFLGENLTIIITILIIILVSLIIFIFIRMRIFEGVFSDLLPAPEWRGGAASLPLDGEKLIEMRVSFQNPHIGFRNIHKIDDNKAVSVGGGFSTFLIFLIPMPAHIGEIENLGGTYIFTPVKEEFFPDLKGPVENCIGKEIPVVSKHGYRTMITFLEYESPLTRINNLLHSVRQTDSESTY